MYMRPEYETLVRWLKKPHGKLIVVTGPRQVGKTTMVRETLKQHWPSNHTYISLDNLDAPSTSDETPTTSVSPKFGAEKKAAPTRQQLVNIWKEARRKALSATSPRNGALSADSKAGWVLALDEIHCLKDWSFSVKGLSDADRMDGLPLCVIVIGSSPIFKRQDVTESLAGRFEQLSLGHWSYEEMNAAFGLDLPHYLYFGGYPGVKEYFGDTNQERWVNYVKDSLIEPAITKDVLMARRVDKPKLLRQLFELSCRYSGQVVSLQKIKGQLIDAGNTTTLSLYLDLLGNAGLVMGLQKYIGRVIRWRASPPKLQVLNTALMSALTEHSFEEAKNDTAHWGRLTESAVGAHIAKMRGTRKFYYWRANGHEVDFVLEYKLRRLAIEVKSTDRPFSPTGLEAFSARFPESYTLIVGPQGMPLEDFLRSGPDEWFAAAKS